LTTHSAEVLKVEGGLFQLSLPEYGSTGEASEEVSENDGSALMVCITTGLTSVISSMPIFGVMVSEVVVVMLFTMGGLVEIDLKTDTEAVGTNSSVVTISVVVVVFVKVVFFRMVDASAAVISLLVGAILTVVIFFTAGIEPIVGILALIGGCGDTFSSAMKGCGMFGIIYFSTAGGTVSDPVSVFKVGASIVIIFLVAWGGVSSLAPSFLVAGGSILARWDISGG
jgi:hypothetical protein